MGMLPWVALLVVLALPVLVGLVYNKVRRS
jgi:hypothetical protein